MFHNSGNTINTNNHDLLINSGDVFIGSNSFINIGSGAISFTTSEGRSIGLGTSTGDLSLSNDEIKNITAGKFQIISSNVYANGEVLVGGLTDGVADRFDEVIFSVYEDITFEGGTSKFKKLTLESRGNIDINGQIITTEGDFSATTDTDNNGVGDFTQAAFSVIDSAADIIVDAPNIFANGSFVAGGTIFLNGVVTNPSDILSLSAADGITISENLINNGNISIDADNDSDGVGTFTLLSGFQIVSNDFDIVIRASDFDIQGTINSGTGKTTLLTSVAKSIVIGENGNSNQAWITGDELQRITTANLVIGNDITYGISLNGITAVQSQNIGEFTLNATRSTADIFFSGNTSSVKKLTATAGDDIRILNDLNITNGSLTLDAGDDLYISANVAGFNDVTILAEDDVIIEKNISTDGNVFIRADTDGSGGGRGGNIIMSDGSEVNAGSGTIYLRANGSITLSRVVTTNSSDNAVFIHSDSRSIFDAGDIGGSDIEAAFGGLELIGSSMGQGNAIETTVKKLKLFASGTNSVVSIVESDNLEISSATVSLQNGTFNLSVGGDLTFIDNGQVDTLANENYFRAAGSITIGNSLSASGTVNLVADSDFDGSGDVIINSGKTLSAVNNILITAQNLTVNGALSAGNALKISNNGQITGTLQAANGVTISDNLILNQDIIIDADTDRDGNGVFTLTTGTLIYSNNNDITIIANDFIIDGLIESGNGTTKLQLADDGSIFVGTLSASWAAHIDGNELQNILTDNLVIGGNKTEYIWVEGLVTGRYDDQNVDIEASHINGNNFYDIDKITLEATGDLGWIQFGGDSTNSFYSLTAKAVDGIEIYREIQTLTGDLILDGDSDLIDDGYGTIYIDNELSYGRDLTSAGDIILSAFNDGISSSDNIWLDAGGSASVTGNVDVNSQFTIYANDGITINNDVKASSYISLYGDRNNDGGVFTLADGATIESTAQEVRIEGSDVNLNTTGRIISVRNVKLTKTGPDGSIGIGNAAGDFSLSGTELQNITADYLILSGNNDDVFIDGAASQNVANFNILQITAGSITFQDNASSVNQLIGFATDEINVNVDLTGNAIDLRSSHNNSTEGTGIFRVASGVTVAANNLINIEARDVDLQGFLNSGNAETKILNRGGGSTIGLGNATGDISISGAELQNITAGTLTLGDNFTSQINIDGVTAAQSNNVDLVQLRAEQNNTSTINFNNNASTFNALDILADGGVNVNVDVTTDTGSFVSESVAVHVSGSSNPDVKFTLAEGATVTSATNISIEADVIEQGGDFIAGGSITLDGLVIAPGTVVLTANDGITITENLINDGQIIINADGNLDGNGIFALLSGISIDSQNNRISITASDFDIQGTINSGSAETILQLSTSGTIGLGFANGDAVLSGAELQNITAANLTVGGDNVSQITVNGVTAANSSNLEKVTLKATANVSGAKVRFETGASTFKSLDVSARTFVDIGADLTVTNGDLTIRDDSTGIGSGSTTIFNNATVLTNNNNLNLVVNYLDMTSGFINTGSGIMSLRPTESDSIGLGNYTSSDIDLSGAELQNITTSHLLLGGTNTTSFIIQGVTAAQSANIGKITFKTDPSINNFSEVQFLFEDSTFNEIVAEAGYQIKVGSGVTLTTLTGDMTLNAGLDPSSNGDINIESGGSIVSNNNNINLIGKGLDIQGSVNAGTGDVYLATSVNNTFIGVGNYAVDFAVSNSELQNISASNLFIEGNNSSGIYVVGVSAASVNNIGTVHLNSGGSFAQFYLEESTFKSLEVNADNGVSITSNLSVENGLVLNADNDGDGNGSVSIYSPAIVNSNNSDISIYSNDFFLYGSLTSGTGSLILKSTPSAQRLRVGGACASCFNLSSTELSNITAGTLTLDGASSSILEVQAIDFTSSITGLVTMIGSEVAFTVGASTFNDLVINSNKDIKSSVAIIADNLTTNTVTGMNIDTQVNTLNFTNTGTGDVIVDNQGGITATGTNPGGSVDITTHSPLTVGAAGISAGQNITLTAAGASGQNDDNLTIQGAVSSTNGNIVLSADDTIETNAAISSTSGTVSVTSTNDAITFNNTVSSSGDLTITAAEGVTVNSDVNSGAAITIDADSDSNNSGDFALSSGQTIDSAGDLSIDAETMIQEGELNSGGSVTLNGEIQLSGNITAADGVTISQDLILDEAITIDADSDRNGTGDFTLLAGFTIDSNNNDITITANDFIINGTINSGTADTFLLASVAGTSIGLGDAIGDISISGAELQNITAQSLTIGGSNTFSITVDNITASQSDNILGPINLIATDGVLFKNNESTFNSLNVAANRIVNVGTNLTTDNGDLILNGDANNSSDGFDKIVAGNNVTLTSAGNVVLEATSGIVTQTFKLKRGKIFP